MPTIRREDGSQFVTQAYRELLVPAKLQHLKRRIRALALHHGENIRIYKQPDNTIEVVFSREPGFLLGETLWYQLGKPANLIYCGALPERRQAILVVVKNGMVFIDAKLSFSALMDEFMSLSSSDEKYDIYIDGDVPLGASTNEGKFAFEPRNVNSLQNISEPLLPQLPILEAAQLQPLELALTSPELGKSKLIPAMIALCMIAAIIIVWRMVITPPPMPQIEVYKPKALDPYVNYISALTTPSPREQMLELTTVLQTANSIPGWRVKSLTYTGDSYTIDITAAGGRITQAQTWAKVNNIAATLTPDGLRLTIPSHINNRPKPTSIYPLEPTLAMLVDQLNQLLPGKNVNFSNITTYSNYKVATVTITLKSKAAVTIGLIGQELNSFPVQLLSININAEKNLYSGTIVFQILGD